MTIENKQDGIIEELWHSVVNNNENIISIHEFEKSNIESYNYAILKIGNKIFGRLLWNWEKQNIRIEMQKRYLPETYIVLENIAFELGSRFYLTSNEIFNAEIHIPIPNIKIIRDFKYFENDGLDYIRWMAFREDDYISILESLNLRKLNDVYLKDGVKGREFIVTPSYSGWSFVIGDSLPNILIKGDENTSNEALTNLCKSLQKLSEKFFEVQYFEHDGKSNITGYFKAKNGKLDFGFWKSETEEFSKGKIPKEIRNLHPTSAHEVASVWSIDPLDFIYLKEMSERLSKVLTY